MKRFYMLTVLYDTNISAIPDESNILLFNTTSKELDETDEDLSDTLCKLLTEEGYKQFDRVRNNALSGEIEDENGKVSYQELYADCVSVKALCHKMKIIGMNDVSIGEAANWYQHITSILPIAVTISKDEFDTLNEVKVNVLKTVASIINKHFINMKCLIAYTNNADSYHKNELFRVHPIDTPFANLACTMAFADDITFSSCNTILVDVDGRCRHTYIDKMDDDIMIDMAKKVILNNPRMTKERIEEIYKGNKRCMFVAVQEPLEDDIATSNHLYVRQMEIAFSSERALNNINRMIESMRSVRYEDLDKNNINLIIALYDE